VSHVPVEVLRVLAWGRQIGALAASPRAPFATFQYDRAHLADGPELAPLLMPHTAGERLYTFRDLDPSVFRGLPPLLADSLPDSFGGALTEAYLGQLGVLPRDLTGLDRLAYLGDRGLGALTFEPDLGAGLRRPTVLSLAELMAAARQVVVGDLTDTEGRRDAIRQLQGVGTSAGGAQAKALVSWNRSTGEVLAGPTAGPAFEPWLLKFDLAAPPGLPARGGAGRIEYAYHTMAQAAGIEVPEARLLDESGRAHFMVRRFDFDSDGHRLHQQSLCAVAGLDFTILGAHCAAQVFQVADSLGLGAASRKEILRRVAFNVLAGNRDDHPKNHAFLMDQSGKWGLAPAYDLTFAHDPHNPWLAGHHLAVESKITAITRKDVMTLADRCSVPGAAAVIDQVEDAVGCWPDHARSASVPGAAAQAVAADLASLRMDWQSRPARR
jgi:serine/threonine-protein kinase HipA